MADLSCVRHAFWWPPLAPPRIVAYRGCIEAPDGDQALIGEQASVLAVERQEVFLPSPAPFALFSSTHGNA